MLILKVGILLILYCLISGKKFSPYVGFAFILLIMGFQSGVGGDYESYAESFKYLDVRTAVDEPFWFLLCKLFQSLTSFPEYVFAVSLFECFVLFKFAKRYVNRGENQWLVPILFFFTFNMMLIQMKALRQGLAIEMCLLTFYLIDSEVKWWKAAIPIVAAYFTHNSSLLMVPFAVWYWFYSKKDDEEKGKKSRNEFFFPVIVTVVYLIVFFLKAKFFDVLQGISLLFADEDFRLMGYLTNEDEVADISMLFVLYNAVIVFFTTWAMPRMDKRLWFFSIITIIASFLETTFFGMGSLFRIYLYFVIFNMFTLPVVAKHIQARFGNIVALGFIVMLIGYCFKTDLPWLLSSDIARFGHYKFIFMN